MNIEKYITIIYNKLIKTYVAISFFSTLIYFVINSNLYTPIEIIFYTIFITILFKGLGNIMLSLLILLFQDARKEEILKYNELNSKINSDILEKKLKNLIKK